MGYPFFILFIAVLFVLPLPIVFSEYQKFSCNGGSSELVNVVYHMGPVLASPINLYVIWYGRWDPFQQAIIRDFLQSISSPSSSFPSVSDWWCTVQLYTDQTGSNITDHFTIAGEHYDKGYSHGTYLTRLMMQSVIRSAVRGRYSPLPLDTERGMYLILTSPDVRVEDFCRAVCGFHYFTFPTITGATVPYAWVGQSGIQCPQMCAFPFAWPRYSGGGSQEAMRPPNGDAGTDGMVSVIAHELAEMSSNPLVNAWYAGDDPTAPTEIADLCMGVYGTGGGGGYVGKVYGDQREGVYNVYGVNGRRFLVQWVWDPYRNRCFGPNAVE